MSLKTVTLNLVIIILSDLFLSNSSFAENLSVRQRLEKMRTESDARIFPSNSGKPFVPPKPNYQSRSYNPRQQVNYSVPKSEPVPDGFRVTEKDGVVHMTNY